MRDASEIGRADAVVSKGWGRPGRSPALITAEPDRAAGSYWRRYISEPENYEVRLVRDAPNDRMSPAEENILAAVFRDLGHLSKWEIVERSHQLPEWSDPHGSSVPIDIRSILIHQGVAEEDADAIVRDLEAESEIESLTER